MTEAHTFFLPKSSIFLILKFMMAEERGCSNEKKKKKHLMVIFDEIALSYICLLNILQTTVFDKLFFDQLFCCQMTEAPTIISSHLSHFLHLQIYDGWKRRAEPVSVYSVQHFTIVNNTFE